MTDQVQEMNTPERLAGVTLATLVKAVQAAAVQAEILYRKHSDSDVLELIRMDLNHVYELLRVEQDIWLRHGEIDR